MLASLTLAGASRYPSALGHLVRTAAVAAYLANVLGLDDVEQQRIYLVAPVHDIGKVIHPVAAAGQIEKYKNIWDTANDEAWPYLPYDPKSVEGQLVGAPQRQSFEPPVQAMIQAIRQVLPLATVLVVDDASPDGTARIAREQGAIVIERSGPRGLGPAYREGFCHALSMNLDPIFQMDADFSHHVLIF